MGTDSNINPNIDADNRGAQRRTTRRDDADTAGHVRRDTDADSSDDHDAKTEGHHRRS